MRLAVNEKNCSGCRVCELVCALEIFGENNPSKTSIRVRGEFPSPGRFTISYCDQCGVCAEVCPVEAIKKHEDGHYYINDDQCTSCMLCVEECPRGVMMEFPGHDVPFKCTLCGSCITYCPRNAIYDADEPGKTQFKEFDEEVAG